MRRHRIDHAHAECRNFFCYVQVNIGNRGTHAGIKISVHETLRNVITQNVVRVGECDDVDLFENFCLDNVFLWESNIPESGC